MKKLFKILVKFIPILQMLFVLLNNILCYCEVIDLYNFVTFVFGNSYILALLLYVISYTFGYCVWYRLIVTGNTINLIIGNINVLFNLQYDDFIKLVIYSSISIVFIILAVISKFNCHGAHR